MDACKVLQSIWRQRFWTREGTGKLLTGPGPKLHLSVAFLPWRWQLDTRNIASVGAVGAVVDETRGPRPMLWVSPFKRTCAHNIP